jgi:hypothetical protein
MLLELMFDAHFRVYRASDSFRKPTERNSNKSADIGEIVYENKLI